MDKKMSLPCLYRRESLDLIVKVRLSTTVDSTRFNISLAEK